MHNASMRLNRIIENFLDVNRLEMGRFELQQKMYSALNLIKNAIQNVQVLPILRAYQFTWMWKIWTYGLMYFEWSKCLLIF